MVLAAFKARAKKDGDASLNEDERLLLWALQKAEVSPDGIASLADGDRRAVESLLTEGEGAGSLSLDLLSPCGAKI